MQKRILKYWLGTFLYFLLAVMMLLVMASLKTEPRHRYYVGIGLGTAMVVLCLIIGISRIIAKP